MQKRKTWRHFTEPKHGNEPEENEDQYKITPPQHGVHAEVALSDGATEASFTRDWAKSLVNTSWKSLFNKSPRGHFGQQFFTSTNSVKLPWYAKEKARAGAFATFLGVRVNFSHGNFYWSAVACGDTCVMHVSGGRLQKSFPLANPEEFGNRPWLVSSNVGAPLPTLSLISRQACKPGDVLLLVTDALAAWILQDQEQRLTKIMECRSDESFKTLLSSERVASTLKNDDATALRYRV